MKLVGRNNYTEKEEIFSRPDNFSAVKIKNKLLPAYIDYSESHRIDVMA